MVRSLNGDAEHRRSSPRESVFAHEAFHLPLDLDYVASVGRQWLEPQRNSAFDML